MSVMLCVAVIAALALLQRWGDASGRFEIQSIEVEGELPDNTKKAMSASLQDLLGESLLRVSKEDVSARLNLSSAQKLTLKKSFPSTLVVRVKVSSAVVQLKTSSGKVVAVDGQGVVLSESQGPKRGPPTVYFTEPLEAEAQRSKLLRVIAFVREAQQAGVSSSLGVSSIRVDAFEAYTLFLDDGVQVFLGSDPSVSQLLRFGEIRLSLKNRGLKASEFDVSMIKAEPNKVVVRFDNGSLAKGVSWNVQRAGSIAYGKAR